MTQRLLQALCSCCFALIAVSACTSQQAYSSSQEWQRNQCNRIIDTVERNHCLEKTNTSYEDYKRQTEALKK